MVKMALSLVVIGATCGLLLVATDRLTTDEISSNREARTRLLMTDMLGASIDQEIEKIWDTQTETFGTCDDWLFSNVESNGYAGTIDLLVLWRRDSGGLVMRVTQHRETPGIGDFIDHSRSDWITALDAQSASAYDELDNVSGATITTAAIRRAAQIAQHQVEDFCERR
jgi:Na+-translocating ferredoxin:NAD+ oxidoreductase RnfG subunit